MVADIKRSVELDLLIADAIGLKTAHDTGGLVCILQCEWRALHGFEVIPDEAGGSPFNPSYDLRDAFAAAEKVGLFSATFWRTLGMDEFGETWGVFEQDGARKTSIAGEQHATPALAICAAILKLKKVEVEG